MAMPAPGKAKHLEELPLELLEQILEKLSFRDIIALAKYTPPTSRLIDALTISPAWKTAWSIYQAHASDFQGVVSLSVPIANTRLFDPTNGALDLTPAEFLSKFLTPNAALQAFDAASKQGQHFIFKHIHRATWATFSLFLLAHAGPSTISLLANSTPLSAILAICPWLNTDQPDDEPTLRSQFIEALTTSCFCVDFYTEINKTKAEQLRALARLYGKHYARLKEPGAPQTHRTTNVGHVPAQLERAAQAVLGTIDFVWGGRGKPWRGVARFSYRIQRDEAIQGGGWWRKRYMDLIPPVAAREMEWLEAFVSVVGWLEQAYPELAKQERDAFIEQDTLVSSRKARDIRREKGKARKLDSQLG
ncbi:hypothetical protein B0T18DRAFT_429476 [Schizothecium vesticola]|uniref:F-box domain-containing protein n=1 Tax=Schizothecium vesticola TaxID=314040 RepID=A0AA40EW75_9PEZI|nr:hypothetical protein B0T18DRAFT_429476 [Schizothecium vesticola]